MFFLLSQIAAFIAEPVMGAGGVIPPPSTYFEKVFFLISASHVLFQKDGYPVYFALISA